MTLWELDAAIDGYVRANSADGGTPRAPTNEEFEAAKAAHGD